MRWQVADRQSINRKTDRETEGSVDGGISDYRNRTGSVFFHCADLSQHIDVLFDWSSFAHCGNDVFYAGRGAGHDSDGRKGRQLHDQKQKALHCHFFIVPARLYHNDLGA